MTILEVRLKNLEFRSTILDLGTMEARDLKQRTKQFSIDTAKYLYKLPKDATFLAYHRQLVRCSSSVGANYRAACRAKSDRDFLNKLKIVEEECDESMFFLELINELTDIENETNIRLQKEANELLSIVITSINTVRKRLNSSGNSKL